MPVAGRKPKPDGQKRNRMPPVHNWTDVVDEPYAGDVPQLPDQPRHAEGPPAPEPARPLGPMGLALWARVWRSAAGVPIDAEAVLVLCEQMDERVMLRVQVFKFPDHTKNRAALRAVDQQIISALTALGLSSARSIPVEWPAETQHWWSAVSRMPHCVLWTDADWQFALDTALVAAAFHAGDVRVASELRQRERILGTTVDSRRDLRIRYVDRVEEHADAATVTAMDTYRKLAAGS